MHELKVKCFHDPTQISFCFELKVDSKARRNISTLVQFLGTPAYQRADVASNFRIDLEFKTEANLCWVMEALDLQFMHFRS